MFNVKTVVTILALFGATFTLANAQTVEVDLTPPIQSDAVINDPTADPAARDLAVSSGTVIIGGWFNEGTRTGFFGFFDLDLNPDAVPFSKTAPDSQIEALSADGLEGVGAVTGFASRGPVGGAQTAISTAGPGTSVDVNKIGQVIGKIGGTPFIDDGTTLLPLPHQSSLNPISGASAITDFPSGNTVYGLSADDSANGDAGSWSETGAPFVVLHDGGPLGAAFTATAGSWVGGFDNPGSGAEVLIYNGSTQQNILRGCVKSLYPGQTSAH